MSFKDRLPPKLWWLDLTWLVRWAWSKFIQWNEEGKRERMSERALESDSELFITKENGDRET